MNQFKIAIKSYARTCLEIIHLMDNFTYYILQDFERGL